MQIDRMVQLHEKLWLGQADEVQGLQIDKVEVFWKEAWLSQAAEVEGLQTTQAQILLKNLWLGPAAVVERLRMDWVVLQEVFWLGQGNAVLCDMASIWLAWRHRTLRC